jgi:hypothetical protein
MLKEALLLLYIFVAGFVTGATFGIRWAVRRFAREVDSGRLRFDYDYDCQAAAEAWLRGDKP